MDLYNPSHILFICFFQREKFNVLSQKVENINKRTNRSGKRGNEIKKVAFLPSLGISLVSCCFPVPFPMCENFSDFCAGSRVPLGEFGSSKDVDGLEKSFEDFHYKQQKSTKL